MEKSVLVTCESDVFLDDAKRFAHELSAVCLEAGGADHSSAPALSSRITPRMSGTDVSGAGFIAANCSPVA